MTAPATGLERRRRRQLAVAMTITEAKRIAGSLGVPSKMPGFSYGMDAFKCQVGGHLSDIPGSTCFNCFAKKNYYATWKPAIIARARREAAITHPRWVDAMVTLLRHYCQPPEHHFRWHDSGDLRDVEHLDKIVSVCVLTPDIRHWMPTKQFDYVALFLAAGGVIPENLCIRLSSYYIDTEPVVPPELAHLPTATVHTPGVYSALAEGLGKGAIECKAIEKRENICGPCRACWDTRVRNVSYPEH